MNIHICSCISKNCISVKFVVCILKECIFVFPCRRRIPLVPTFRINPTSILCSLDARAKITQTHLCANFCTNQFVGEGICIQISFCTNILRVFLHKYLESISVQIYGEYFCRNILRVFLHKYPDCPNFLHKFHFNLERGRQKSYKAICHHHHHQQ